MVRQQFVVTRYAHGACGRFVSTVLQTSPQIACWDETVQNLKLQRDGDWAEQFRQLAEQKFADDPLWHLRHEPDVPYCTNFYSGNYNRGENVSLQQYLEYQEDCPVFWQHWTNVDYLNLILHKSRIPEFMQYSKIVNVLVDTEKSLKLAKFFSWIKRFHVCDANKVMIIANDPERGNPKRAEITKQFNNPIDVQVESPDQFKEQTVDKDPIWDLFADADTLTSDPTNQTCEQISWSLNSIFDRDDFVHSILQVFENLDVEPGDIDSVVTLYDTYWSKQQRHIDEFGSPSILDY